MKLAEILDKQKALEKKATPREYVASKKPKSMAAEHVFLGTARGTKCAFCHLELPSALAKFPEAIAHLKDTQPCLSREEQDCVRDKIQLGQLPYPGEESEFFDRKLRNAAANAIGPLLDRLSSAEDALTKLSKTRAATIFIDEPEHVTGFFKPIDAHFAKLRGVEE